MGTLSIIASVLLNMSVIIGMIDYGKQRKMSEKTKSVSVSKWIFILGAIVYDIYIILMILYFVTQRIGINLIFFVLFFAALLILSSGSLLKRSKM